MRIETTKEAQQINIPPFVRVLREVTEEEVYETRQISDLKYIMPEKDKKDIEEKLKGQRSSQPALSPNGGTSSPVTSQAPPAFA
jgi:hypothetical protein